jgi:hypothetical protein
LPVSFGVITFWLLSTLASVLFFVFEVLFLLFEVILIGVLSALMEFSIVAFSDDLQQATLSICPSQGCLNRWFKKKLCVFIEIEARLI